MGGGGLQREIIRGCEGDWERGTTECFRTCACSTEGECRHRPSVGSWGPSNSIGRCGHVGDSYTLQAGM